MPKRSKPVLVMDCDGVLCDLTGYVLDTVINPQLGTEFVPDDITDWHLRCLGQEARRLYYKALGDRSTWALATPYDDAAADCQLLARDYDIYVVTAMHSEMEPERRLWLDAWGFPYRRLITGAKDKAAVARELFARAAFEDNADNANDLAEAAVPTWLVARPYNASTPLHSWVHRGSWEQGVEWALQRANGGAQLLRAA